MIYWPSIFHEIIFFKITYLSNFQIRGVISFEIEHMQVQNSTYLLRIWMVVVNLYVNTDPELV